MDWRILLFPPVLCAVYFIWKKYLSALKTDERAKRDITVVLMSVAMLFSAGFAMRLSGAAEIVDLGFYFTDFAFLMAYLLIAVAALLGQAKYHST
jgi:hypothetical protein